MAGPFTIDQEYHLLRTLFAMCRPATEGFAPTAVHPRRVESLSVLRITATTSEGRCYPYEMADGKVRWLGKSATCEYARGVDWVQAALVG